MNDHPDLTRLRNEYSRRRLHLAGREVYSFFYLPYLFSLQQRLRSLLSILYRNGYRSLKDMSILEVGCGGGGILLELLTVGALPQKIFGIDLLHNQLYKAHQKLAISGFSCADGQRLPFPDQSFDFVFQFTAFSSVLVDSVKQQMATDMLRVLRPNGVILWYDFWLNPTNPQTKGIGKHEIRKLFPGCSFQFQKITLAPPIARRIVPLSWIFASFLESLKIFNSHYLVLIKKGNNSNV